jgi:hypothetical protein
LRRSDAPGDLHGDAARGSVVEDLAAGATDRSVADLKKVV